MHVEDGQNIDILPFSKHFMIGTALYTNEIKFMLQRYMQVLVSNKIIIAFTKKKILLSLC